MAETANQPTDGCCGRALRRGGAHISRIPCGTDDSEHCGSGSARQYARRIQAVRVTANNIRNYAYMILCISTVA